MRLSDPLAHSMRQNLIMRHKSLLTAFASCLALAASGAAADPLTLGDSGVACRLSDGHSIDVPSTIDRLSAMHVNTYLYDIPHDTDAWDKLPAFADAAARKHIDVWVYLFPWSLAHRGGKNEDNQPYGTDYVKWCGAVGKLMAEHPNLKGIVMDDFASNIGGSDHFTPDYVHRMLDAGHSANRAFAFQPILYFDGPWEETLGAYGSMFRDGAIVCYPRSEREVNHALTYLDDQPRGASLSVGISKKRRLKSGEETVAVGRIDADAASRAHQLSFFIDQHGSSGSSDQHGGAAASPGAYHAAIRVEGEEVWHRTLSNGDFNRDVTITLPHLTSRSVITLAIVCDKPSEDEGIKISLDDLRLNDGNGLMIGHQPRWIDEMDDGIAFEISQATTQAESRWQIPMTIMVAGSPYEHNKIFGEPGDAAHIGPKVKQAVQWAKAGKARGVMTWWTPKDKEGTDVRDAVTKAFDDAR